MKYALISTLEKYKDGLRVVEVSNKQFEVCETLEWKECPDYVWADMYYYKPENNTYELSNPDINNVEGSQPDVIG